METKNALLARLIWNSGKPGNSVLSYDEAKDLAAHPDAEVRRTLAGRGDLAPEILYYLSEDPDPGVRRAIAGNAETPRLADLKLVEDADAEVRSDLARKIARLAPGLTARERDKVRRLTYSILDMLARDQLPVVRRVISETLRDEANAPPEVINRLARDVEILVSAPVLEFSPVLSDDDLLDIIHSSPTAGAMVAIARRHDVGGDVADAIARGPDLDAVISLLNNGSAQLREDTLNTLVERAETAPLLHEPLVHRPNLPSGAARRLATFVADSLLTVLAAREDMETETLESVRDIVRRRLEGVEPLSSVDRHDAALGVELDKARALAAEGKLGEEDVCRALSENATTFAKAALAVLSDLSTDAVQNILDSASPKALVALAWRAGLTMTAGLLIQTRLGHINPDAVLADASGDFPLSEETMAWQLAVFTEE